MGRVFDVIVLKTISEMVYFKENLSINKKYSAAGFPSSLQNKAT